MERHKDLANVHLVCKACASLPILVDVSHVLEFYNPESSMEETEAQFAEWFASYMESFEDVQKPMTIKSIMREYVQQTNGIMPEYLHQEELSF